jgi:hypothetical protein
MRSASPEPVDGEETSVEQERQLDDLIEELLRIRASGPPASDGEIRRHRHEGRP